MKSILYPIERRLIIMRFEHEMQSITKEMLTNTNGFRAIGLLVAANAILIWFRSAMSSLNPPGKPGGVKVVSIENRPFSASRVVKIQLDKEDREFTRKLRESLAGGV